MHISGKTDWPPESGSCWLVRDKNMGSWRRCICTNRRWPESERAVFTGQEKCSLTNMSPFVFASHPESFNNAGYAETCAASWMCLTRRATMLERGLAGPSSNWPLGGL